MSRVDLLFLAHNRLEFTRASWNCLNRNTDWELVGRILIYDDASTDGTLELLKSIGPTVIEHSFGSPVSVLGEAVLEVGRDSILAKIDNDVMLPPGWLNESLAVMDAEPELDLLGIEATYPVLRGRVFRETEPCEYIGGIGLMRTRAFQTLPEANGRFGFTAWQDQHPEVKKAWLNPSLPVCLLDRVPFEPWKSLSAEYVANGWQRPWEPYDEAHSVLWKWWT